MQKELIDKANEIIGLIEKNERAVIELEKCLGQGDKIYSGGTEIDLTNGGIAVVMPQKMFFEPWEMRLMVHNKKQRIKALKAQLERMRNYGK